MNDAQRSFQEKLLALGGTNLRGEPILRVIRGDEVTKFACGRMIPKYFVPGGAVKEEIRKYRLRHIFTGQITDCTFEEAKEVYDRSANLDITNHYIAETCKITNITVTARDGYFVEQWLPPEKIKDTPESWEAHRYQMWMDEEKGKEVLTDMVGPFPYEGMYDLFVSGPELNDDLLNTVRRALFERDRWKQTKSDDLMVQDIYDAAEKKDDENEALVTDMLKSEMAPHAFRGLYLNKPGKFIHQGREK